MVGARRNVLLAAGLLLAAACVPLVAGMGLQNVLTKALIAGLFAMAFNLAWGQGGMLSFGQAAYFGIGAFTALYAMGAGGKAPLIPLPFVPLAGFLVAAAAGLVAGWIATTRSGIYFAMITFALAELLGAVAYQWDAVFGGEAGIRARREDWAGLPLQTIPQVYLFTLAWFALSVAAIWFLSRGPFGLVMRGLKEREDRIAFLGYDTHAVKTATFTIAAGFSGAAGALLGIANEAANVAFFSSHQSTLVVLNAIIGGTATFLGPLLGAVLTTFFGYYAAIYTEYWTLYLGVAFVLIVLFAPEGIAGLGVKLTVRRGPDELARTAMVLLALVCFGLGLVIATEIIGAIGNPAYGVARRAAGGGWPPVRVLGLAWRPDSPLTILTVVGLFAAAFLLAGQRPRSAAGARLRAMLQPAGREERP